MDPEHNNHFLVVGGGAVGLAVAGFLSGKNDVSLLCRTESQARLINESGVETQGELGNHATSNVLAISDFEPRDYDAILIATKYRDTPRAVEGFANAVMNEVTVISLQNGITNSDLLRGYFARNPIVESVIPIGFERRDPRTSGITFVGGPVIFGGDVEDETLDGIVKSFIDVDFPAQRSNNFAGEQWKKYIFNLAYNALSGVLNKPNSKLTSWQERQLIKGVIKEAYRVMEREGIEIDGLPTAKNYFDYLMNVSGQLGDHKSSLCQDLSAGKSTEVGILNDELSRRADDYGISTPTNDAMVEYVLALEEGRVVNERGLGFFANQLMKSALRSEGGREVEYVGRSVIPRLAYATGMAAALVGLLVMNSSSPELPPEARTGFTQPKIYGDSVCMDLDHQYTCRKVSDVDPNWLAKYVSE